MDRFERACADILKPHFEKWAGSAQLSAEEARAFWLREIEKRSIESISLEMFCSDRTIFRLVKSARKKLSDHIA